jgi:prepilin-type N-terminal cleavage/methylation domain-containing protein
VKNNKGFSLLELMFVLTIVGVVATFAVPYFFQSTAAAREVAAISVVRNLVSSQMSYSLTKGFGNFSPDLPTLETAGYIDSVLATGTKNGYLFSVTGDSSTFTINARPQIYGSSGVRSFFSDISAVIRYNTADAPADTSSPPIPSN